MSSKYYQDLDTKQAIDAFLQVNRSIQSDLDRDSSEEEKQFARLYWDYAKEKIQKFDPSFWDVIKHQDD